MAVLTLIAAGIAVPIVTYFGAGYVSAVVLALITGIWFEGSWRSTWVLGAVLAAAGYNTWQRSRSDEKHTSGIGLLGLVIAAFGGSAAVAVERGVR